MTRNTKAKLFVGLGAVIFGLICGGLAQKFRYEHVFAGFAFLGICVFGLTGGFIVSKTMK